MKNVQKKLLLMLCAFILSMSSAYAKTGNLVRPQVQFEKTVFTYNALDSFDNLTPTVLKSERFYQRHLYKPIKIVNSQKGKKKWFNIRNPNLKVLSLFPEEPSSFSGLYIFFQNRNIGYLLTEQIYLTNGTQIAPVYEEIKSWATNNELINSLNMTLKNKGKLVVYEKKHHGYIERYYVEETYMPMTDSFGEHILIAESFYPYRFDKKALNLIKKSLKVTGVF